MKAHIRYFVLGLAVGLAGLPGDLSASWHEGAPPFAGELRDLALRGELHPRIIRGGAWPILALGVRAASRVPYPAESQEHNIGFRLAGSLPPAS